VEREEGLEGSAASVNGGETWRGEVEQFFECAFTIQCDSRRIIDWSLSLRSRPRASPQGKAW
jgi:hypothetical protein